MEGVFWRIIQYSNLYNFEQVQARVQDVLARAKAMRETFRAKIKRMKDLSVNSGLFPGPWKSSCSDSGSVNTDENLFTLQDSIADFKCNLSETVFCFNIE